MQLSVYRNPIKQTLCFFQVANNILTLNSHYRILSGNYSSWYADFLDCLIYLFDIVIIIRYTLFLIVMIFIALLLLLHSSLFLWMKVIDCFMVE